MDNSLTRSKSYYQKFFLFYNLVTHGIHDTEFGLVWTTPWPDQKDLFLKLFIWNNSKLPYEKLTFFLGKLYQKFFLFYQKSSYSWDTRYRVWFGLDNSLTRSKRPIFLLIDNRKFLRQAIPDGILDTVFGLVWTTPWPDQKDLFLKLFIWNNSKLPYETLTLFLGKLYQKFFLFYHLVTHGILDTKFGFIWITPWPDQKRPIFKISYLK